MILVPEKRRTPCCNDTLHFGGWTNSNIKERCSGSRAGEERPETETKR